MSNRPGVPAPRRHPLTYQAVIPKKFDVQRAKVNTEVANAKKRSALLLPLSFSEQQTAKPQMQEKEKRVNKKLNKRNRTNHHNTMRKLITTNNSNSPFVHSVFSTEKVMLLCPQWFDMVTTPTNPARFHLHAMMVFNNVMV